MKEKIICVDDVSIEYKIYNDKIKSIKEYAISAVKGKMNYTKFKALENVSFEVEKGEVLGIVGRNGAGKSTLLKVISQILKPTEGSVSIGGNIVPMLELGSGFDHELNGIENIYLNGAILGYTEEYLQKHIEKIIEFSELGDFIHMPIRNYSSGMLVRLAFSIATIVKPDILIVDEILAVGDIDFQKKSKNKMMDLMTSGTTVLFVSHSIEQTIELCDKVLWLEHGKVMDYGNVQEVCAKYIQSFE